MLAKSFSANEPPTVGIENDQTLDKPPPETGDTVPNVRCARKKTLSGKIESAVLWTATKFRKSYKII